MSADDDQPAPRAGDVGRPVRPRRALGRGPGAGRDAGKAPPFAGPDHGPAAPDAPAPPPAAGTPAPAAAPADPVPAAGTATVSEPGARPVPEPRSRGEHEPVPEPGPAPADAAPSERSGAGEGGAGGDGGRDDGEGHVRGTGADAAGAGETAGSDEADDRVFKVRLGNFEGPFDLLLQLISKHKLDVTEVALSKVTDEFMAHIRAMGPDWDLDQTTEFLVVAATLLDLKAARLLPAAEVEDEADLALLEARDLLFARLLQYRAYKQIAEIFRTRLDAEARRHPRTVGLEPHHAELLPEVVISIGPEGFAKLAVKAMQPKPEPQVYVDHIHTPLVSVVEQAEVVVARLRAEGEVSFRALVADVTDTLTVVARFLALLELYREKAVALDQDEALGELTVRWTGGDGDVRPAVTDEFDRAPEGAEAKRAEETQDTA